MYQVLWGGDVNIIRQRSGCSPEHLVYKNHCTVNEEHISRAEAIRDLTMQLEGIADIDIFDRDIHDTDNEIKMLRDYIACY